MLDRQSETEAFKRVDLSIIAASLGGFEVEKKRTTKKTVLRILDGRRQSLKWQHGLK